MNTRPIVGPIVLAVFVLLMYSAREGGGSLHFFLEPASFATVIGGCILFLVLNFSFADLSQTVKFVLSSKEGDSEEQYAKAMSVLDVGARAALALGVISFILGIVAVLSNLSDPSRVGPAFAMTLMSILYAVALAEFFFQGLRIQCVRKTHSGWDEISKGGFGDGMRGVVTSLVWMGLGLIPMSVVLFLLRR